MPQQGHGSRRWPAVPPQGGLGSVAALRESSLTLDSSSAALHHAGTSDQNHPEENPAGSPEALRLWDPLVVPWFQAGHAHRMAGPEPEPVSSAAATTPAPSAPVVLPKTSESDQLLKIRHSMSHVMAMACSSCFPGARHHRPLDRNRFLLRLRQSRSLHRGRPEGHQEGMIKIINKKLPLERSR